MPVPRFFKTALVLLTVALPPFRVAADNDALAALQSQLATFAQDAPASLPIRVDIVKTCWRACPDEAKKQGLAALSLLDSHPEPELEAQLLIYLPRLYIREGDYPQAQALVTRGLDAANLAGNTRKLANIQFNQAIIYSDNNKFILAENAYQRLYQTYQTLQHGNGMASALNNMGRINHRLHNYGKALQQYQEALAIFEAENITHNYANTLANIGEIYRFIGEFDSAEASMHQALEAVDKDQFPDVHTSALSKLADVYIDTYRFDEAEAALLTCVELAQQNNLQFVLLPFYSKLTLVAIEQQDLPKAQRYFDSAKAIIPTGDTLQDYSDVTLAAASLAIAQQDYQQAASLLSPVIEAVSSGDISDSNLSLLNKLIEVTKLQQHWQEASALQSLYLSTYEEQVQLNRDNRLEEYDALYKASEKERQIAQLQADNQQQSIAVLTERAARNKVIFIATIICLTLFVFIYWGTQKRRVLSMKTALMAADAEKKKQLFSDISHELRTPLSVLKLQIEGLEHDLVDDPKQTYQILHNKISSINHLISDISHLAQADAGDLNLLFESVELKPFFQQWCDSVKRLPETEGLDFSYKLNVQDQEVAWLDPERIRQVLNNLFSNSLRYTQSPGKIEFKVRIQQQQLQWYIQDSAPGLQDEQLTQVFERLYRADPSRSRQTGGSGLGLTICKSFIEAHRGKISASHSVLGGVRIEVTIPIDTGAPEHAQAHTDR
ncbi:ATP-binding protein [Planctobacterium marinum]|uniref:ATP-binding protein n=1 Tax=Planctobacterium marinum TaxID=1631968 RepID=UPI001E5A88EC|nr:ATP-binding protein [Planctobacterium marinum]MCC2606836.1 tetratricopeptide repeat protein [Planctobacterium marinum]